MKGRPLYLLCPNYRRLTLRERSLVGRHDLTRTERERDTCSRSYAKTGLSKRWLHQVEIYCMTCGYRGWTAHPDVAHLRIAKGELYDRLLQST